jgi:hypothetical protein
MIMTCVLITGAAGHIGTVGALLDGGPFCTLELDGDPSRFG